MRFWAVVVPADQHAAEHLHEHETLVLAGLEPVSGGDRVALIADVSPPIVFALTIVEATAPMPVDDLDGPRPDQERILTYTHRLFDQPRPVTSELTPATGGLRQISEGQFRALLPPPPGLPRRWLVSVSLPIEAADPAEAVAQFWSYVGELGPDELPVFVSPSDDELGMQAYAHGEPVNLDPEEDE